MIVSFVCVVSKLILPLGKTPGLLCTFWILKEPLPFPVQVYMVNVRWQLCDLGKATLTISCQGLLLLFFFFAPNCRTDFVDKLIFTGKFYVQYKIYPKSIKITLL